MDRDFETAPASFTEMYEQYFDYVKTLLVRLRVPSDQCEDVAQDIFLRFHVNDIIGQFDASRVMHHDGKAYKAKFRSFLSVKVELYARGKRERAGVLASREVLVCDTPVDAAGTRWIEMLAGASDDITSVEAIQLIQRIRAHLRTVRVRGVRDLSRLFELVIAQLADGFRRPNRSVIARQFGISNTAVGTMFGELRTEVRNVMALTEYEYGGNVRGLLLGALRDCVRGWEGQIFDLATLRRYLWPYETVGVVVAGWELEQELYEMVQSWEMAAA